MTQSSQFDSAPVGRKPVAAPTEWAVGLLVPPLLLGLLISRALADGLTQAGLASEQIFSGERLPNLNMPLQPQNAPTENQSEN
jgi:hypothetical protein